MRARRLRRLAGETPGEGLPAKKLSTGQFFLPVLRFASHYAGGRLLGVLRGIPRLRSRLVGSAPETPAAF